MIPFSGTHRSKITKVLKEKHYDIIVIGGGITGAGILLDAQSRGLSCALIEKQDFAEGTSSRSTKLIHGGLRYLKQWNFKQVSDTGKERIIVEHIARHLTYPKKVIVPSIKNGTFSKFQLSLALWVYEKLAQVPKQYIHKRFTKKELETNLPAIDSDILTGGIEYVEFQTNDARLTIENIKKGLEFGASIIHQTKVTNLTYGKNGYINGVRVKDSLTMEQYSINSTCIINATGAWSDQFSSIEKDHRISPSKGVHLVFNSERFPLTKAVYFDTPDDRMIFAIPDENCTYVGTTDTFYNGNIDDLSITLEEKSYLLDAINTMFPRLLLQTKDIISGWVGVRPLIFEKGKSPSEISRKHEVYEDPNGLLTIAGGKLTGYRKMARKVIDKAIQKHFCKIRLKDCHTKSITLTGSDYLNNEEFEEKKNSFIETSLEFGWSAEESRWVYNLFGSQSDEIRRLKHTVESSLPSYLLQALLFCIAKEMVSTPSDFILRRTNLCYFHPNIVAKYIIEISRIIYIQLDYSEQLISKFDDQLTSDLKESLQ